MRSQNAEELWANRSARQPSSQESATGTELMTIVVG